MRTRTRNTETRQPARLFRTRPAPRVAATAARRPPPELSPLLQLPLLGLRLGITPAAGRTRMAEAAVMEPGVARARLPPLLLTKRPLRPLLPPPPLSRPSRRRK